MTGGVGSFWSEASNHETTIAAVATTLDLARFSCGRHLDRAVQSQRRQRGIVKRERWRIMSGAKRGPLPPVFFLVALLLQWGLHVFLPVVRLVPEAWSVPGLVPIIVGVGVMVAAARQFANAETAIKPFDQPSTLVTRGVFRVSRNPMYLAMIVILIGGALAWGTLTPLLIPPVLALLLSRRFIVREEASLSETFGASYGQYKGRVRRWL